jgi:DNA-directed RNA polymerase specialized sigma24 family protein
VSQLVGVAGFRCCDEPDIRQDLALALRQRIPKFNPHRAHWNVFVVTVVERQVATLLQQRRAQKRQLVLRLVPLQPVLESQQAPLDRTSELECAALQHDIELVLRRLPYKLRVLWEVLQTDSATAAAGWLQVTPQTVYNRLKVLRRRFQAAGLGNSSRSRPEY